MSDAVTASAKGATFLILVQIVSKALTFAMNQLLLRHLSPALLGASVQLELYKIGVLYFSRESLRVATERRSPAGVQAAVNLSYLALLAGVPIGLGFAQWYLHVGPPDVPWFVVALRINEIAAVVELLSEPAYVTVQQKMLFKIRAAAEVPGVMVKTATIAAVVFWSQRKGVDLGVLPFAVGELANSATLTLLYLYQTSQVAKQERFSLFPRKLKLSPDEICASSLLFKPLLRLSASLYFQTGIKWALTEGDKLLVAAFASLEAQGMYALSANYGGFLARMVFKPIEDTIRNLFANLCAAPDPKSSTNIAPSPKPHPNISTASHTLRRTLRLYTTLSLPIFALGPHAFPLILKILAGSRWTHAGAAPVFAAYSYYIPLLALNGVTEAFVAATASTADLRRQSLWMGLFSALFAGSAWLFLRVLDTGARGLVWANCLNMSLRIVFNLAFCRDFLARHDVRFDILDIVPGASALAGAAVVPSLLGRLVEAQWLHSYGLWGELAPVSAVAVIFGASLVVAERDFLWECYASLKPYGP